MDMDMDMDLDMGNFADYGSLNHLSNNGLSVTNIVDELDYFDVLMPAGCHSDNVFGSLFDENKLDAMIWHADTVEIPSGQRSTKKSLFDLDSDVVDEVDLVAWKDKEKEEWNRFDTVNWLISTGVKFGHSFASMSPGLALPGKELLNLSKREFIMYDRVFGKKLFKLLHKGRKSEKHQNPLDDFESTDSEDEVLPDDKPAPDLNIKRLPGRPPNIDKKTKQPRKKLSEFITDALHNPELCPPVIRWVNYEEKTFHIVDPVKMSELWGKCNNKENSSMNPDKFRHAMRYYYKKDVFQRHPTKDVYKFGENATGWQTDCPNFDPNYFGNKIGTLITLNKWKTRKRLLEFITDSFPELCRQVICWNNYEEKTFRIVDPAKMSEIWGDHNNKENSSMNYEKFSRAMRYYYKKDVLQSVPSKLVYKFGENATGWQTDCPNFDPNYFSNKVKSEP